MSGSVMIFMASIVVFAEYSFFLGPGSHRDLAAGSSMSCTSESREWRKITFNCASDALSLMAATAAFLLVASSDPRRTRLAS